MGTPDFVPEFWPEGRPRVEAPAEIREMSQMTMMIHQSNIDAGFTSSESLQIIGVMLSTAMALNNANEQEKGKGDG
jgi:hypothetical protein